MTHYTECLLTGLSHGKALWPGPSTPRTVSGHMKAQVALLTPGVGKLSYRIHRRGAATNWDMSHLFKGASKTLVSIAAGGSTESLQSQMEGELLSGGFTHLIRNCRHATHHWQLPNRLGTACLSWFQMQEKPSACPGGTATRVGGRALNSICSGAKTALLPIQSSLQTEGFWPSALLTSEAR